MNRAVGFPRLAPFEPQKGFGAGQRILPWRCLARARREWSIPGADGGGHFSVAFRKVINVDSIQLIALHQLKLAPNLGLCSTRNGPLSSPCDARALVGQGDRRHLSSSPSDQCAQPVSAWTFTVRDVLQDRVSSLDEHPAYINVASAADRSEPRFSPGTVLLRCKPQKRGEVPAILECFRIAHRGNDGGCSHGPNAWDTAQPSAGPAIERGLLNGAVVRLDPLVNGPKLLEHCR